MKKKEKEEVKKKRSKHNNDNPCPYCGVLFSKHRKCKRCGILLHEENPDYIGENDTKQYTLVSDIDPDYCEDCYFEYIM